MSEKPVMCGCGGKAAIDCKSNGKGGLYYFVWCIKCGTSAGGFTFEDAIKRWNTAMSGNRVRLHNVIFEDEREPVKPFRDANPKRWRCGNCGSAVKKPLAYCQKCGVKLEWKEERNG